MGCWSLIRVPSAWGHRVAAYREPTCGIGGGILGLVVLVAYGTGAAITGPAGGLLALEQ